MRVTSLLFIAWICVSGLVHPPLPVRAQTLARTVATLQSVPERRGDLALASPDWWRDGKKRFHQLALCALASANVTYTLLVGFSGVGAAIGFTAALLGVVMCL